MIGHMEMMKMLYLDIERLLLPLKKLMLTMKSKLLFQVSFTAMIKTSRKKLKKSTESWRIYVRAKRLIFTGSEAKLIMQF